MAMFNWFSKKITTPYKDEGVNKIYDLLFCDKIELYKQENNPLVYPWDVLLSEVPDANKLTAVAKDTTCESRPRALAYNLLLAMGNKPNYKDVLGVIVEIAMPNGLDVLAAYSDGSARYLNHSARMLVWETRTEKSTELIEKLFAQSNNIVNQIGPWDKERRPFPVKNMVRLTFLVSDGLTFGEGPFSLMEKDPMGGPVIAAATELLIYLTSQVA